MRLEEENNKLNEFIKKGISSAAEHHPEEEGVEGIESLLSRQPKSYHCQQDMKIAQKDRLKSSWRSQGLSAQFVMLSLFYFQYKL
jgi:hypothetical protein